MEGDCLMGYGPNGLSGFQPKPDKGSKLAYLVVIMGSLAFIIISIFGNKNIFPEALIKVAIILILILYLLLIIYIFFSDSIISKLKQIMTKRKEERIARKYLPELKRLKNKFNKIIMTNNGITGVFDRLRSESEKYHDLNVPQLNEMDNLLLNLDGFIEDFDHKGRYFELVIDQFEAIMKIYNEFYIKSVLMDIKCIKQRFESETIPENIKKKYHDQKTEYDDFVKEYLKFGEVVNSEYGIRIVHDYVEKIEEL